MTHKSNTVVIFWLLSLLLSVFPVLSDANIDLPALGARVNDFTATLSPSEISDLERTISEFERAKGSQIAIAIVPTTGAIVIEDYAVKLEEKWKIGREKEKDGVLLVVAKNDRKLRIEVGYGLEGAIPDAIAKRIIDELIVPEFKKGNFFGGIKLGIDSLIKLINGENLPAPKNNPKFDLDPDLLGFAIIFSAAILGPMHSLLKKSIGNFASASVFSFGASALGYFFFPLTFVLIFALLVFVFLLIGAGSGSGYSSGSGGGSSGGGFSSGGGGFSGGGGSSGGGGASGSW